MNHEPKLRFRSGTTKTVGAVAVVLAFAAAVNYFDQDGAGCDTTLDNPLSWVACPIGDIGHSLNKVVSDELSTQMQHNP